MQRLMIMPWLCSILKLYTVLTGSQQQQKNISGQRNCGLVKLRNSFPFSISFFVCQRCVQLVQEVEIVEQASRLCLCLWRSNNGEQKYNIILVLCSLDLSVHE